MSITYHDVQQRSGSWFMLRKGKITASNFDKVLMKANTKTYQNYAYQLAYERVANELHGSFHGANFERGELYEPVAREFYEIITGKKVTECGFFERDLGGVTVGASPDGILPDGGLLEIKTKNGALAMQCHITNAVPEEYMGQVQGQMLVTGAPYCDFLVYCEGLEPFIRRVMPDAGYFAQLTDAAIIFEQYVQDIVTKYIERTTYAANP